MDSILEEASLNIERNEKLANFGLNYGVFVQDFHVMRVRAGLLYLATLLSVQFALSFIYLTMQSYPCFQLLLVFSLITCLLLVLRFGEPFVDKKRQDQGDHQPRDPLGNAHELDKLHGLDQLCRAPIGTDGLGVVPRWISVR